MSVEERPRPGRRWYALALLLPPAGFVAGIVLAARRDVGPALAVWATSFFGVYAWAFAWHFLLLVPAASGPA